MLYRKLRLFQGMVYRRLCHFLPAQMNIVGKMNVFLDSKYSLLHFGEVFASRTYYPAIELFKAPPKSVLDLGAHQGFFTLLVESHMRQRFAGAKAEYTLYEANPRMIKEIQNNLAFAGMRKDQARIYCGAVGKRSGKADFKICKYLDCSGISPVFDVVKRIWAPYLDIEENLEKDGIAAPQLIKIDIEGSEVDLFENYERLFSKTCVVVAEFHEFNTFLEKWHSMVEMRGLQLYELTQDSGLSRVEIFINRSNLEAYNAGRPPL